VAADSGRVGTRRIDVAITGIVLVASAGTAVAVPLLVSRSTDFLAAWLLDALALLLLVVLSLKTRADRRERRAAGAFRLLAENSGDMVCRISPDGSLLYVSPAGRDITGSAVEELRGRSLAELVHPDDRAIVDGLLQRLHDSDGVQSARMRIAHRERGWVWTETTGRRVCDDDGRLAEMHAAVRDIHARHHAEELTRRQRDRAEALLVLGRRLAGHTDAGALAQSALDGLCALTGAPRGVLWTTSGPDRAPEIMATRGVDPERAIDVETNVALNGDWLYIPIAHGPLELGAARIGWESGERRDDFDRVALAQLADQAAAALANALSLRDAVQQAGVVRAMLDATPDGIELVNTRGERVMANPPLARLMEDISPAQPATHSIGALAARVDDPDAFLARLGAIAGDPEREVRHEYTLADSGRTIACFTTPVRDDHGALMGRVFVHREVTAERQAERLKDEFLALVSHELRTPLTSIIGYAEVLLDGEAGRLRAGQRRFLEIVERNGQRLLRLVGDLLVVAQAEAGQLDLTIAPFDLAEVAREAVDGVRPMADEHGITLELRADEPMVIHGDRTRLGQVLDNLLSNALAYTPEGGSVVVSGGHGADDDVYIEVADSGIGIPRDECDRLFERFYRGRTGAGAAGGTGLGLAISKAIVEGHGGQISVDSDEGEGATFRFHLPTVPLLAAGTSGRSRRYPALCAPG
jgi:PAS domain S-box-containing protein